MSFSKIAGAGLVAATCAFSSIAYAEQGLRPEDLLVVKPNGEITTIGMTNKQTIAMMTKEAEEVTGTVMVMVIDGKTYLMKDHKLNNGQMAFDWITHEGTR